MSINFDEVRRLENTQIRERERWIYSTDANDPELARIEEEIDDLKQISDSGGIALILAHQGRFGKTEPLDYVADFLSNKLRKTVYFPENNTERAVEFAKSLNSGDIAVMGNTRFHEGEEKNDSSLAKKFAELGEKVAVGGFGKAHRENSSNFGILDFLPGYLTRSQIREMKKLERWAGKNERYSVAVLGGIKKEKITDGLAGFVRTYDAIIPGGIVLNTILKANGYEIGNSVIKDGEKDFVDKVREMHSNEKILIPDKVIIARKVNDKYIDVKRVGVGGIPENYMIVDFVLSESARKSLERCVLEKGRIIMAGTPGIYVAGFREATDSIIEYMNRNSESSIALGGDTAEEIKTYGVEFKGEISRGGGSALYFLAYGTTVVFEKLKENKEKFKDKKLK